MNDMKIQIGTGKVLHSGRKAGGQYVTLCGAKANRSGGIWRYATAIKTDSPVTCVRCLAKLTEAVKA